MAIGEKIRTAFRKLGQKTRDFGSYIGQKISDNKGKILGGLLTAGLLGTGLLLSSQNKYLQGVLQSKREDPLFVSDDPLPRLNIGQHPLQRGAIVSDRERVRALNYNPYNQDVEDLFRSASDVPFEMRN